MSIEGIDHELVPRGVHITNHVHKYPNNQGSVYYGYYQGQEVGIKVKYYSELSGQSENAPQEFQNWKKMQHPNVKRLFDCFWAWNNAWYLVFVMEWCQWDGLQDIDQRRRERRYYTEQELFSMLRGLTDALTTMQNQLFAHHNIKLENIYPSPIAPKIGDFSCAKFVNMNGSSIVSPSPSPSPFLSPELRQSSVNVFKADTYSLGVVMLSLALLEIPACFKQATVSRMEVELTINTIATSQDFKQMLRWMLAENPDERCDFLQMNRWFQGIR
jgi:serine/threonine protein kinase